ncbi:hypothetical protein [Micromonospora inyonensis]|uniref:Uncharacterized protein n=1 Tax=Micromonospora inyonensis TaxID=47866 RepID=A0A1C6SFS9_9ACTN|nr:hypothetical protein [Micromonospora inyonensis]SCL28263.1 hypothetical protein GA0074694_5060 [Micromonospora inyonensis]
MPTSTSATTGPPADLVTADHIAPAEVRLRPAAHAALAADLRSDPTPADLTRPATTLGLTRPRVS